MHRPDMSIWDTSHKIRFLIRFLVIKYITAVGWANKKFTCGTSII